MLLAKIGCTGAAKKAHAHTSLKKTSHSDLLRIFTEFKRAQVPSKSWQKNGWKNSKGQEVKNKELIQDILNLKENINSDIKICFKHVMSHTKEPSDKNSLEWLLWYGNNKVDSSINELFSKNNELNE
jgi:ribonuclease HI